MNRFYKDVATGPAIGGGFAVLLDGRPVRTPDKSLMAAPTEKLAALVAAEWDAQGDTVIAASMPLTQLLTTTIDRKALRAQIEAEMMPYLNGDLLCYRADEPEALVAEQDMLWNPWLDWFAYRYGVSLLTTNTLVRLDQPDAAHTAVRAAVSAMDDHMFTAMHTAVSMTGSMVLGLALTQGAITPEDAMRAALCEEFFYERIHDLERHGLDPIEEKRRASLARDLAAVRDYITATSS